jgi:Spy/CpxP family protein refolding chaperone
MKVTRSNLTRAAASVLLAMALCAGTSHAQDARSAPGDDAGGPGLEAGRGMGPGMGPGVGMGPGMGMGRHGRGPGGAGRFGRGGPQGAGPGGPGFRFPGRAALESLGLSDAQRTKLEDLRDQSQREAIRAGADLRLAELDLRKLVESDKPDQARVDAAIERMGSLRTAMLKSRINNLIAFRNLLTPAQRAKLRDVPQGPRR